MRQKNLLVAIALVTVMLCATVGGTLAYWVTESYAANKIETGNVHVKLLSTVEQYDSLYPGDVVPHVIDVQNDGDLDALVRLKVRKSWTSDLSPDNVLIEYNNTYWLDGGDGYFYYKGILAPGQKGQEPLLKEFELDSTTSNAYKDKTLTIDVDMEYIQAANNAISSMWGKTYQDIGVNAPQPSANTAVAKVDFVSPEQKFTFSQGNDLFLGFKGLAPGDKRSQVINVTNSYNDEIEVFIRAAQVNQDATGQELQKVNDLLQKYATITVRNNSGQTLYNGAIWGNYTTDPVGNNSMKNDISLGKLAASGSTDITVDLELDPTIENDYQDLAGNISWVIRATGGDDKVTETPPPYNPPTIPPTRGDEDPTPTPSGDPTGTPTLRPTYTPPVSSGSPGPSGTLKPPKVGDDSPFTLMLMAIALLTCTLIGLIVAYMKQRKLDRKYR